MNTKQGLPDLLCAADCCHPRGDILIASGITRCVGCRFEHMLGDAEKALGNSTPTVIIKRARFDSSYWRRRFICECRAHERTRVKLQFFRAQIANMHSQLPNPKGK